MIRRKYHFYFMLLSVIMPLTVWLGMLLIIGFHWVSGNPDPGASAGALFNPVFGLPWMQNAAFVLVGIWGFSVFSIWMYIWNLAAFFFARQPAMRQRMQELVKRFPLVFWIETSVELRDDRQKGGMS